LERGRELENEGMRELENWRGGEKCDLSYFYLHNLKNRIQTVVTPQKPNFDMSVSLPVDYVGKEVHVLFYKGEEITTTLASVVSKKKPSDFLGILTKEEGEKFQQHILQARSEWDRDI
jgi:hypothetical protein